VPARLTHAHHIEHWLSGGPTDRDNLASLCGFHHRRLHDGVYTIHAEADTGLRFETADGRSITVRQLRVDGGSDAHTAHRTARAMGAHGVRRRHGNSDPITAQTPRAGDAGGPCSLRYVVDSLVDACEHARRRNDVRSSPDHDP
jgi:hypothetical protein